MDQFVAVRKDDKGNLTEFKTQSGQILNYEEAMKRVASGEIEHVTTFIGKDGDTYIRSVPDHDKTNNLDSLPTF
ncbi:DUF3892 domain-containing protein [Priestia flexa]|jgi:Protein of unknown function (DUF3892)|uniref:DUF3892 domain-containing protein n=1 Tax=Priestia flexa TaxID=86664 RepID=A0A1N7BEQ2_9BACI|nr:DUF3892 domain-containing protein [Priestia flexa]AQX55183.1 hypothetical protein BC359_13325 [Priestia flexa]MBN8253291.1 DUF3892 domain-containing protein [Priestia flexa]MBN8435715.1 DUF3892 domain-containing protein [Priestia flexa]MBY6087577.1 DUF3892 domain-containing protein [Priestia flexa]MCA0968270.1 DUF3892 domain-containing protein [Priestia flexa]